MAKSPEHIDFPDAVRKLAWQTAALYAAIGIGWILFSDQLLRFFLPPGGVRGFLQSGKGLIFVTVTAALLYFWIRHHPKHWQRLQLDLSAAPQTRPRPWLPYTILAGFITVILLLGGLVFYRQLDILRSKQLQDLKAIAQLQSNYVQQWRQQHLRFAQSLQQLYQQGQPATTYYGTLKRILPQQPYTDALVVASDKDVVFRLQQQGQWQPPEQAQPGAATKPSLSTLHGTKAHSPYFTLMIPLPQQQTILLRVSPQQLFKQLRTWPYNSTTGETILTQPQQNKLRILSPRRHQQHSLPLVIEKSPQVQPPWQRMVRGYQGSLQSVDYRQTACLLYIMPVADSPWHIVAKIDETEALAPLRNLGIVGALGTLFLIGIGVVILRLWWRQQRYLYLFQQQQLEQRSQQLQQRLQLLSRYANDMMLLTDEQGWILDANDKAIATYGLDAQKLSNHRLQHFCCGDTHHCEQQWQQLQPGQGAIFECLQQGANGESFPAEISTRVFSSEQQCFYQNIIRDISDRKAAQRQQQLAAQVYAHSNEGILILDQQLRILSANPKMSTISGYSHQTLEGHTPYFLQPAEEEYARGARLGNLLHQEENFSGELWLQRQSGEIFPTWANLHRLEQPLAEDLQPAWIIHLLDTSEEKQAQERIHHLAHFDTLTGLPNRTLFYERLEQALQQAADKQPVALLFCNLDNLQQINNSLGHNAGDKLLQLCSKRLQSSLPEGSNLARFAGDIFCLALPAQADPAATARLSRRLLAAINQGCLIQGQNLHPTASIGISYYPQDSSDSTELLSNAEAAMHFAKREGRNTYRFYTKELNAATGKRLQLENELRLALERKELQLYYQPRLSLSEGHIIGAEALVRWNHPQRGFVSPGDFIPIAESCGLIVPMGRWILDEACRQQRQWLDAGTEPVPVAVNISVLQLRAEGFVENIEQALEKHQLPASFLELEITESVIMENASAAVPILEKCKSLGLKLAIDDFGTGYSSLAYLQKLPMDFLKIDRAFINGVENAGDAATITRTIINLGHSVDMKLVAEGVENQQQLNFLRLHSCDEMQGFFFSKPLPAADYEKLLRQGAKIAAS